MKEDNNEYQEKLSDQIEQIRKCIHKDNLSDKEKIECIIDTFSGKKRYQKNTFSKKVISKTPKTKTEKKMNNNVPRVTQNKKKETEKEIKVKEKKMNNNVPRVTQNKKKEIEK